jgi:archaellum component FlaG (FlaF/FlaG flagellin family)
MARTVLSVQSTNRTPPNGLSIAFTAAAAAGHSFDNSSEKAALLVKNTGGSACNVTIKRPAVVDGMAMTDLAITVPATNGEVMIGPFPKSIYNQTDTDNSLPDAVLVDTSVQTGVSLAVIKFGAL